MTNNFFPGLPNFAPFFEFMRNLEGSGDEDNHMSGPHLRCSSTTGWSLVRFSLR